MIQICRNEFANNAVLKELYEKLAAKLNELREDKPSKETIDGLRTEQIKRELGFPDEYINHDILDMGDVMQYYSTCGVGESNVEDHKEDIVRKMEVDTGAKNYDQPLECPDRIAEQIAKM